LHDESIRHELRVKCCAAGTDDFITLMLLLSQPQKVQVRLAIIILETVTLSLTWQVKFRQQQFFRWWLDV